MALGRGTAEALFFKRYGIEFLPIMYIFLGGMLVVVTSLYASFADRFPAENLLKKICLILSVLLFGCWMLMFFFQWDIIYPIYFLLYELASEILLVHGALYVSQNFDTLQSKRLIPLILAGAQIGTIIGGLALAGFSLLLGVESLLLIWIVTLAATLIIIKRHHQSLGSSPYFRHTRRRSNPLKQTQEQFKQCFHFAKQSKLMKSLSWCLFFTVVVFYSLSFSVNKIYTESFTTEAELSSFFGVLVAANGLLALLIQLFVTNKLIDRLGVRKSNLIFPTVTLFSFAFLFASLSFSAAIFGSFVKDALMPALRNPIRNMFFNAIPGNLRGRAHAFSIGLVLPLAMMLTGVLLILIQQNNSLVQVIMFGLLMSAPLFWYSVQMNKTYGPAILDELRKKVFVPDASMKLAIRGEKKQIITVLKNSANSEHEAVRYAAAEAFLDLYAESEMDQILTIVKTLHVARQDVLLQQIMPLLAGKKRNEIYLDYKNKDKHLQATLLICLIEAKDNIARDYIKDALDEKNPRIIAAAIYGVLHFSMEELSNEAWTQWGTLLASNRTDEIIAGLSIFQYYPSDRMLGDITAYLQSSNIRIQEAAVNTLPSWPKDKANELFETILNLTTHYEPQIRLKALSITRLLPKEKQNKIADICLQDNHLLVRDEAAKILFGNEDEPRYISNWLRHSNFTPYAKQAVMNLFFSMEPQTGLMPDIAYDNLKDAEDFYRAYKDISSSISKQHASSSNIEVLRILLLERSQQTLDNVLQIISQYEDRNALGTIYSGLKSNDSAHIANACEALSTLSDSVLSRRIIKLVENLNEAKAQFLSIENLEFDKFRFKKTLDWCSRRNDNWLLFCAKEANSTV